MFGLPDATRNLASYCIPALKSIRFLFVVHFTRFQGRAQLLIMNYVTIPLLLVGVFCITSTIKENNLLPLEGLVDITVKLYCIPFNLSKLQSFVGWLTCTYQHVLKLRSKGNQPHKYKFSHEWNQECMIDKSMQLRILLCTTSFAKMT